MNAALWLALAFSFKDAGEVCRPCHAAIVDAYRKTGMGRSVDLRPTPAEGTYYHRRSNRHYRLAANTLRRHQTDAQGREVNILAKSVDLAIGSGNHAVTYVTRTEQGRLLELPLTWYSRIGGYRMSPGYDRADHEDFRREISGSCLFCHSDGPDPAPIGCGRCHGSVEAHLKAPVKGSILNPAKLTPERQFEVCLQCHLETASRGIQDSMRRPGRSVWSYQPGSPLSDYKMYFDRTDSGDRIEINHGGYRLIQSACYRKSEGKLVCTTCHDPHSAKVRQNSCQACHLAAHSGEPPAGSCESCHMPKRVPSDAVHTVITDHKIARRPRFVDPVEEDNTSYTGDVVPFFTHADELSRAAATQRGDIDLYRRLVARDPENVPLLASLGKALLRAHKPVEAARTLEEALRLDPMYTDARCHLGVALAVSGDHKGALAQLRRAVADNPDHSLSWINLGITLEAVGDKPGALAAYTEAVRLQPDSSEARQRRARLYTSVK